MHRASAALAFALIVAIATACGSEEAAFRATAPTTVPPVTSTAPATTLEPSTTVTTAPTPSTTTRPSPTTTTRPPTTTTTAPKGRTAPGGVAFSVTLGEAVAVPEAGVSVTFTAVVSDNRCRPGRQCIVAGNAVVSVRATQAGMAPADLVLNTDGPVSVRYGSRTVELVDLSFGQPPVARLKVS